MYCVNRSHAIPAADTANTDNATMPGPVNGNESVDGFHFRFMHRQVSWGVKLMTACVMTGAHNEPLSQYMVPRIVLAAKAKPQSSKR